MTDLIIITALAVVLGVIIGYQIGKASVKQPDTTSGTLRLDTQLLSKWENEKRTTKISTRYVLMNKVNMVSTNDSIKALEECGYAVTDYDAEDKLITMEKNVVIQPKTIESGTAVYIVTENYSNGEQRNVACFGTKEEALDFIRKKEDKRGRHYSYKEWKVGEP